MVKNIINWFSLLFCICNFSRSRFTDVIIIIINNKHKITQVNLFEMESIKVFLFVHSYLKKPNTRSLSLSGSSTGIQ